MALLLRHRKKLIAGALSILALLFIRPARDIALTLRVLSNLGAAAREEIPTEGILRLDLREQHRTQQRHAYLYRRQDITPRTGLLFVPGLTKLGPEHPRFVAMARILAKLGYTVVSPDIPGFRRFKLEVAALEEMSFWYHYMKQAPSVHAEKVGIVGISVAGTLALMTAAQADIRETIAFVVSIGGYQDLGRCSRHWFSSKTSQQRHGDYSVRCYGRWISMLAALDRVKNEGDRHTLDEVLRELLSTGRRPARMPDLTKEGQRWYQLAVVEGPPRDLALIRMIQTTLSGYFLSLSPDHRLPMVKCPVFLAHGLSDELIPSRESLELQTRLTATKPHLLLTPLISHTHPRYSKLSGPEKWSSYFETARFLYAFVHSQPFPNRQNL